MQIVRAFVIGGIAGLSIGLFGHGVKNLLRGDNGAEVWAATITGAAGMIIGGILIAKKKKV